MVVEGELYIGASGLQSGSLNSIGLCLIPPALLFCPRPADMPSASQHQITDQNGLGFYRHNFDWATYIKHRPQYPPLFYSRLYDYHAAARPTNIFQSVHDEGTGPGLVAEKLAERFAHVIASDPNIDYIKAAKERLAFDQQGFPADKFSFVVEGSEKSSVTDESQDCVTILEAIHWTDFQKTVSEAARQLKSGGTFCVVHYSLPQILDNNGAQRAWKNLVSSYVTDMLANADLNMEHRALQTVATGYDCIRFSEDVWEAGTQRRFTNCGGNRKKIGFPIAVQELEDKLGKDDKRTFVEEDTDWETTDCDLEWFQKTMDYFLGPSNSKQWFWNAFSDALEESDGKVTVSWPNVQIFATKK